MEHRTPRKGDTADTGDDPGISGSDGSNVIDPGSGTVFIGDTGSSTEPTEVTETDLTEIQLPEILTSEPKSSTVGGAGDDEPEEIDEDTGVSTSLLPPAGKSGGAISAGGSGAESGAIPENAITFCNVIVQDQTWVHNQKDMSQMVTQALSIQNLRQEIEVVGRMVLIKLQQRLEHLKVGCHSLRKKKMDIQIFITV